MFIYETQFKLTNPVNNFYAAASYLQDDDMTAYLKDDLEYKKVDPAVIDLIEGIEWQLLTESSGKIVLKAKGAIPDEILEKISEWIRGQNSDGLGEGFEQQSFAEIYDEDEFGDPDPDTYDMCSFDWETNSYPLKLVSGSVKEGFITRVFKAVLEGKTVRQALSDVLLEGKPTEGSPLKIDAPRGAFWLWMDQDGNIYGSAEKPDPKKNVVDARGTVDFSSQGFDDVDEVIAYVKKYF